jgi:phosphatidylserine/phosphatidylglycerophosphate/cardiolipin synthase-like enzyme
MEDKNTICLLNTAELIVEIRKMFQEENEQLIIASPYIDTNNELIEMLSSSSAKIHFFIRIPKPNRKKEIQKINTIKERLSNVNFIEIENLHAKAYISKDYSIITSLNLLKSSQENNFELGIVFKNADYTELHNKIINELKMLLKKNNHDMNILEENKIFSTFLTIDEHNKLGIFPRKVYNMKYLYRDIMKKNGINWASVDDGLEDKLYRYVCDKMLEKYKHEFKPEDYYIDRTALYRQTWITREMYLYGINTIKPEPNKEDIVKDSGGDK